MTRATRRLATLVATLALAGCDTLGRAEPVAEASAPVPLSATLLEATALARALTAIESELGKEIAALELDVHPDRVVLQARDPHNEARVLQYVYRHDKLEPPRPVRLQGSGTLEDNLFPLSEARLDRIPELVKRAVMAVDAKHGKPSHVLLRRNLPHEVDVRFRIYVTSPIRSGHVDATADGELAAAAP